ncbi:hypothetical protein D3C72_666680 [compost metagenome]
MREGLAHRLGGVQKRPAPIGPCRVHRPRHDVSRGQIGVFVRAQQEGAGPIDQPRPLAAQGFGGQGRRVQPDINRGGVKLHELRVEDFSPGPIGQGQPLAAQGGRIGRHFIEPADAAGGQHHGRGEDLVHPASSPFDQGAAHPTVHVLDQAAQPSVLPDLDMFGGPRGGHHRRQDGPPRAVAADPRHARQAVRRLQRHREAARLVPVEGRAQRGQPLHRLAPALSQGARRLGLDQTGPRALGVLGVQDGAVLGRQGRRQTALGPGRGTGVQQGLRRNDQGFRRRGFQRGRQARQSAADDQGTLMPDARHASSGLPRR